MASSSSSSHNYATRSNPAGQPITLSTFLSPFNDGRKAERVHCTYRRLKVRGCPPCPKPCRTAEECRAKRCKTHLRSRNIDHLVAIELEAQRLEEVYKAGKEIGAFIDRIQNEGEKLKQMDEELNADPARAALIRLVLASMPPPEPVESESTPMDVERGVKRLCCDDETPAGKRYAGSTALSCTEDTAM